MKALDRRQNVTNNNVTIFIQEAAIIESSRICNTSTLLTF